MHTVHKNIVEKSLASNKEKVYFDAETLHFIIIFGVKFSYSIVALSSRCYQLYLRPENRKKVIPKYVAVILIVKYKN